MSDFLGHLVARTLARPTLRPRVRSRFEPASAAEEPPLTWPTTPSEPTPLAEPIAVQRKSLPATAPAPQPSGTHASPPAGPKASPPRVVEVPRVEAKTVERTRPIIERIEAPSPPPRIVEVQTPPRVQTRVIREATHDVERVLETQTSDRVIREAHHTIEREAREKQPREHRFEKAPPQIVREHRETEVERERALRTTIDRPPRILREHTTNTSEPAGKTEPIIEVSIGRIEVRAVTATPQKQTQRTAQPMTIDDYVARRKARERR